MGTIKTFYGSLLAEDNKSCYTALENIKINKNNISGLNFDKIDLKNFLFDLSINQCDFEDCTFTNCTFNSMDNVRLVNCTFKNCYFRPILVNNVRFLRCTFIKGTLASTLKYDYFQECIFSNLNLRFKTENSLAEVKIINCNIGFIDIDVKFFKCPEIKTASVQFTDHGECGRALTCFKYNNNLYFKCGCFYGTEAELKKYIKNDKKEFEKSRNFALETVISLINYKN